MRNFHINTQNKNMIWLELGLLAALCAVQFAGIPIACLLLTAAMGLYMALTQRLEDAVLALFVALPMFNLFNYRIGNISMYYLFVFVFWYKYFRRHNWRVSSLKLLTLLVLLGLRLTSGEIRDNATWFVLFSVLVLTYGEDCLDGQIGRIVKYLTISFLIASVAGYLMQIAGRSLYTHGGVYSDGTRTIRFAGLIGDSVFYSQCCALLIAANLVLACYHHEYRHLGVMLSVMLCGFSLLSYAKTGLIIIAADILVYVLWQIGAKAKKKSTVLFSVGIILAFIGSCIWLVNYILSDTSGTLVQNYLTRFASSDLLTGRLVIWEHYWDIMRNSWRTLFCAMPQAVFRAYFTTTGTNLLRTTHNIYIELVCAFGLIAAELILLWIIGVMARSVKRRDGMLCLLPMLALMASGMALHGLFEYHYYTLVAIALSFLNYRNRQRRFLSVF